MKKIYLKTSKLNLKDENDISDLINLGDWCYDLKKIKFKVKLLFKE